MVEEEVWEVAELQAEPWTVNKDWKGFKGKWLCRGEAELQAKLEWIDHLSSKLFHISFFIALLEMGTPP